MIDMHSDVDLLSSGINIKAANVEQEAASAVASVDT